jgi:hypothetical protein
MYNNIINQIKKRKIEQLNQTMNFISNTNDTTLRKLCYLKDYIKYHDMILDELKKRGGLCLQFYSHFTHKYCDYINSRIAKTRVCFHPMKNGKCFSPMEWDEKFISLFDIEIAT